MAWWRRTPTMDGVSGRSAGLAAMVALAVVLPGCSTSIKADETVILFPTAAHLDPTDDVWEIPIHGWVFEAEGDSLWRAGLVNGVAASLGLDADALENEYFRRRAWMFLVDNERGKDLRILIDGDEFTIGRSGANGHVSGTARMAPGDLVGIETDGWVPVETILPARDPRSFPGAIQLLSEDGLSVISDIDDTIKVSDVANKQALLANTFLKEFHAVPGMAELYRRWADSGAAFHYVSSSPWQLYPALAEFLDRGSFPRGSFDLRQFRIKDESFLNLFQESDAHKTPAIERLVGTFPGRRFILIGDSGERDPEIYGDIARRFPGRIEQILIRDVSGDSGLAERLAIAFADIPQGRWAVFRDPVDLDGLSALVSIGSMRSGD